MRWIDIPPVWLIVAILATWGLKSEPFPALPGVQVLAVGFALIGGLLMVLAVWEMRRHRTTVIPHLSPDALVSTGIFRWTRNPIYLGDVLVLVAAILWWGAWLALPLVPLLVVVLTRRFIVPEEARLRATFGDAFDAYTARTRRWV